MIGNNCDDDDDDEALDHCDNSNNSNNHELSSGWLCFWIVRLLKEV